jgi:hypothetical protein
MSNNPTPREEMLIQEYCNLVYGMLTFMAQPEDEGAKQRATEKAAEARAELISKLNEITTA